MDEEQISIEIHEPEIASEVVPHPGYERQHELEIHRIKLETLMQTLGAAHKLGNETNPRLEYFISEDDYRLELQSRIMDIIKKIHEI